MFVGVFEDKKKKSSEISWPLILSQQWAAVMAVQGFNKLPPQKWLPRHWIESYKVQWKQIHISYYKSYKSIPVDIKVLEMYFLYILIDYF